MQLITLPNTKFTYLTIKGDNFETIYTSGSEKVENAQFIVDSELSCDKYQHAKWWRFWKKTKSFSVFACVGVNNQSFFVMLRLQEK